MNIIYENNTIRLLHYNNEITDVVDIRVFIKTKKLKNNKPYIAFNSNDCVICELKYEKTHDDYTVFKIVCNEKIKNGLTGTRIILINPFDKDATFSDEFELNLSFDYSAEVSKITNETVSKEIEEKYAKIMKLTEMNINIHKEICELVGKEQDK